MGAFGIVLCNGKMFQQTYLIFLTTYNIHLLLSQSSFSFSTFTCHVHRISLVHHPIILPVSVIFPSLVSASIFLYSNHTGLRRRAPAPFPTAVLPRPRALRPGQRSAPKPFALSGGLPTSSGRSRQPHEPTRSAEARVFPHQRLLFLFFFCFFFCFFLCFFVPASTCGHPLPRWIPPQRASTTPPPTTTISRQPARNAAHPWPRPIAESSLCQDLAAATTTSIASAVRAPRTVSSTTAEAAAAR